jgi:hypothetical protein
VITSTLVNGACGFVGMTNGVTLANTRYAYRVPVSVLYLEDKVSEREREREREKKEKDL